MPRSGLTRRVAPRTAVDTITRPGAPVGGIALLLGSENGAAVEAIQPSVLRRAVDGQALLTSDPAITRLVATGLAERLNVVTTYLADLKLQSGDAPGLSMVSDVLSQLGQRHTHRARVRVRLAIRGRVR